MPELDFHPQTAREALFEIRRLYAAGSITDDLLKLLKQIDETAELGLERREPINFELGDDLGDCLAEAHKVLREVASHGTGLIARRADEVLVLPPQIEVVVERRIGPRS
jgi:hypothetical protein